MHVVELTADRVDAAATIHADAVRRLRHTVAGVPDTFDDPTATSSRLTAVAGYAAVDGGHLVGYLAAMAPVPHFRRTDRAGAYVPTWAHGVCGADAAAVYAALYSAASADWCAAGCSVHAITILEDDQAALDAWFRMGFGCLLVDAVVTRDGEFRAPARLARMADATALAALDAQHVLHYGRPPTSMVPPSAMDDAAWQRFLATGGGCAFVAEIDGRIVGFIRLTDEHGGSDLTAGHGAFVDGLYVEPDQRGRGIAGSLLDTAVAALRLVGIDRVTLDHETTNPTADAFWSRHATPVARSLARVLE